MRTLFSFGNRLLIVLLLAANFSYAQTVKLEQGQNGGVDKNPVSPITWATGNSNSSNSHYFEGQSIPYRLTISSLRGGNHTVEIEWDTRSKNKSAIDYITNFDRICEDVIPGTGIPSFRAIPAPNGIPQPSSSFNKLTVDERKIAIYGGTIGTITYVLQENISAASAITRLRISFTTTSNSGSNNTVVIAWGGHIASAQDWGQGNSASSISGSPYHTRLVSLNGKSLGSQSRSVQAVSDAIDLTTDCNIVGPSEVCAGSSATYSVPAGASSYTWSVSTGGAIISGAGTNSITVKWTTSGTVSVNIANNKGACFPSQCSLNVTLTTPPTLSVVDAVLCSTENGGRTAIANLNNYVTVDSGNLIFKRNNQPIGTPGAVLVTNGDVIEVSATGSCGSTKTFKVTVNDRQIFGICSQGKVYKPIGAELSALYEIYKRGQTVKTNEVFLISGNEVLIEVIYFKDKFTQAKAILEGLGFVTPTEDVLKQDPNSLIIAGFFPILNLLELNEYPEVINSVSQAIPGVPNKGATTTQGDRVMRSNLVRAGYVHKVGDQAIDGTGIKIGVLSDSYNTRSGDGVNTLASDISNGDLPAASLYFLRDLPSRFGIGTDEGRAMMQIIHDVAPGAQLGFRTGVVTSGDFAQGIRDLEVAGSDIIVDDITYITEPFFRDGKVAKAVNEVTAKGVSYFTSAGNFGSKSFEGVFTPVSDPSIGLPLNSGAWTGLGRVHQFSGGSTSQSIKVFPGQNGPAVYMIALQWDDPLYSVEQTGSLYDLDIYLKDFGVPLYGFNRNNANGDPIEILSFTVAAETTINLLIARECASCTDIDSNKGIKFKYVVFRGELDPNDQNGINASTIVGHANSVGAMAVGAVLYSNTSVFGFNPVPSGILPFTVATFSSRGGTTTNGVIRNKPDFTAPNGVNTTVNLGAPDLEGDNFPNFFGTSAAAPHAAAIAALVKQARIKYYPGTNPTNWVGGVGISLPADIRRVLKTTSQDMHELGEDIKSGSGLVRADRALLSLAAPNPDNIELVYESGVIPGKVEFILRINGTNLYEGSKVYLRKDSLSSTYKIDGQGFGYLEVRIPLFDGNPGVTVVNNAISDSKLDGGTAGPVFFFDIVKKTIAIRADNLTKKYAQVLKPFIARVYERVDNNWVLSLLTLEEVGLTLNPANQNISLNPITLLSPISGDLAEAGTYVITASHSPTGFAFSDFFNYVGVVQQDGNLLYDGINNAFGNYGPGIITVETLPITIKPVDRAVKYGESISDALTFEVIIAEDMIAFAGEIKIKNVPDLKVAILNQYLLDLALAKQPGDNSLPLGIFNGTTLQNKASFNNKSFMVSARTMINGRTITNGRTILNGRTIINSAFDVPAASFVDYLDNQENQALIPVTINGRSMINSRTMVNSRTIVNGRTMINSRTIINARTFINGRTLINSRTIINTTGGVAEDAKNNSLVIFGEKDLEGAIEGENVEIGKYYDFRADTPETNDDFNLEFFSINMVTGTGVGNHFIIPGTFESRNFIVSYLPADLTITPATLTAKTSANPALIKFGDTAPQFATEFLGFEVSTSFFDRTGNKVTLNDDKESVINSVAYSLVIGAASFPSTGTIAIGTYSIRPQATLFTPANYLVDLTKSTFGSLSVIGCANKAPKVGDFMTAKGAGNSSNPATISRPANIQIGDLLIVSLMFEKGQAPSVTPPDNNWVFIQRVNQQNHVGMVTYYKVVKSNNEPETYRFRINQSPKWTMGITRVSGADINHRDGPIVAFSGASGSPAFIATAPSFITTDCNTMVMMFFTNKKNATWTPPAGTIEVYDDPNNQQGLTSNMMSYYIQSDPGPTGNLSATASMSENWVAQAIAIRPLLTNVASARINPLSGETVTELSNSEELSALQGEEVSGELKAYPNPVKDRLNLRLKGVIEGVPNESSLVISDALGRNLPWKGIWHENESRLELDFSQMNIGFYIINIRTVHGVKSVRVIKK